MNVVDSNQVTERKALALIAVFVLVLGITIAIVEWTSNPPTPRPDLVTPSISATVGAPVAIPTFPPTLAPTAQSTAADDVNANLLEELDVTTHALHDMTVSIVGESMDHIKLTLEVFNAAAKLLSEAKLQELNRVAIHKVADLRKILVLRQRQAFPLIRKSAGRLFNDELWLADGKARSFGDRYSIIEFIAGSFAANANIAEAQKSMRVALARMRFKQARYRWVDAAVGYTYYKIENPSDDTIAKYDEYGNFNTDQVLR